MDDKETIDKLEKRIEELEDQVFDMREEKEVLLQALSNILDIAHDAYDKA
jgi:hypothetical protein